MVSIRAVVFDWRGTLVVTLTESEWVERAFRLAGRTVEEHDSAGIVESLCEAKVAVRRELDWERVDCDAAFHRCAHDRLFELAGVDAELAQALYAVESDSEYNPFAADAPVALAALKERDLRVGVLSDIHFDIRPAFARCGLLEFVDAFVLSFEHGVQKPDPAIFGLALEQLRVPPAETLMVGDRASHDGGAVEAGMPTLLLPALTDVNHERLDLVLQIAR